MYDVLKKSLISEEGLGSYKINIEDETLMKIAETSNGDVRTALNGLEVAVLSTKMDEYGVINITNEIAKEITQVITDVTKACGRSIAPNSFEVVDQKAPHEPGQLREGKMAVYIFVL